MVALTHHWVGRADSVNKKDLGRVWKDMKAALLMSAVQCRVQGQLEAYFWLYLLACLGEEVVVKKLASTSASLTGHLCTWEPRENEDWSCVLSIQGQMERVSFPWTQLLQRPDCLDFQGQLHRKLLLEAGPTTPPSTPTQLPANIG